MTEGERQRRHVITQVNVATVLVLAAASGVLAFLVVRGKKRKSRTSRSHVHPGYGQVRSSKQMKIPPAGSENHLCALSFSWHCVRHAKMRGRTAGLCRGLNGYQA
jgi:hypothetical protein